jgi:hypothetical protein
MESIGKCLGREEEPELKSCLGHLSLVELAAAHEKRDVRRKDGGGQAKLL